MTDPFYLNNYAQETFVYVRLKARDGHRFNIEPWLNSLFFPAREPIHL